MQMHFEDLPEYFEDVLSCLLQYCGNLNTKISLQALDKLKIAIEEISNPASKLIVALNAQLSKQKEAAPATESKTEVKCTFVEDSNKREVNLICRVLDTIVAWTPVLNIG
jgi:hypothetical protein